MASLNSKPPPPMFVNEITLQERNPEPVACKITRKRGRPCGSFGRKKRNRIREEIREAFNAMMMDTNCVTSQQIRRKRGRPRKYRDKIAYEGEAVGEAGSLTNQKQDFPVQQEYMNSHIIELFACWICDETFSMMAQLTSHLTNCSKQSVKSEPKEADSSIATITHNAIIKETAEDNKVNVLLESDIPVSDREFSEENELAELVPSLKSQPSSPESPYVNLTDDKFTVKETDVKTEESNAELNNPSPPINRPHFPVQQEHMNSHIIEPFTCWICSKTFSVMAQLTSHLTNCSEQSVKSEPKETDSNIAPITHNDIIQETAEDKKDNILLESDVPAGDREFSEENELAELVSSPKSEPSSSESPYVNLDDDKFTVEETEVKTEESNAELNNPSAAINGSTPGMVDNNDPHLLDWDQNQQKKSYKYGITSNYINASDLHEYIMSSRCKLQCWICGERSLSEAQLTSHIATHNKPYMCKLCDHNFFHLVDYEKHTTHCSPSNIATHVRKYMCKFCDKSYLYLSDYESHLLHCLQNHIQSLWHNGSELFSCVCGKTFITKVHLEAHLKTHTKKELLKCPSIQIVTNETESSIAAVTHRKDNKKVEEYRDVVLPESDRDCIGPSISMVAHEKSIQKRLEEQEEFILPEDAADWNVPASDKELCEQTEQNELMDSVKSEPSSAETIKSSQKNHSPSSPFHRFVLPKSDAVDGNVPVSGKKFCENTEFSELEILAKNEPSVPESCKSSQKNRTSPFSNLLLNLNSRARPDLRRKWDVTPTAKNFVTNMVNYKGPYKCSQCPKLFARKSNLTAHRCLPYHPINGAYSSTATVTRNRLMNFKTMRKLKLKNLESQKHHILPDSKPDDRNVTYTVYKDICEPDRDCNGPSTAKVTYKEVIQKNLEEHKNFVLPESDPGDRNVPISDKDFFEQSELLVNELMDSVKSKPSSAETFKSSQKNHSSSSPFHNFILPEPDPVDRNVPGSDKEFCEKSELNDLVDSAKSELSSSESPYINIEGSVENEKNFIQENVKKTEEFKPKFIHSFIQFLAKQ